MKVLVCIPCLMVGGTEVQTLNLVRALVEGGHRVTTVCYFEHCTQMIEAFRKAGSEVILLSADGKRKTGKKMISFLWKGLRSTMKAVKPDMAHVQYMAPGAYPIIMLRLMGVKKIIATAHTSADIYTSLRLVHFIQKYFTRAFTCITERAERSFFGSSQLFTAETILKKRNHFTIYNALPHHIDVRTDTRILGHIHTIGVVSRLEPIKGMDLVIPAFAKTVQRLENSQTHNPRLLVVGDGSLKESMMKQARDLGVNDLVTFTGRKDANDLQIYYDMIDVLLMPSRSEGFGLTAIEGMARGCVVVAADTGGLPEVVEDGVTGLLHRCEDTDDMAEKMIYLAQNPFKLQYLSENALDRSGIFSFKRYADSFCNLYEKLK